MMLEVLHGVLAGIMVMVTIAWLVLLRGIIRTFRLTPHIRMYSQSSQVRPKVSVILPARNEEEYIGRCLDSLVKQDYDEYEVIAVNDSSDDSTESIISDYANKRGGWERTGLAWRGMTTPPVKYYYLQTQILYFRLI